MDAGSRESSGCRDSCISKWECMDKFNQDLCTWMFRRIGLKYWITKWENPVCGNFCYGYSDNLESFYFFLGRPAAWQKVLETFRKL